MTEFLGIPMTVIMIVLLGMLALGLAAVATVWIRNPILFSLGLRNIPRRRAQSVLIVAGLMLSTVIIASAFAVGDTVNYSITNDTYNKLGHVDELIQIRSNRSGASLTEEQIAPTGTIPKKVVEDLFRDLKSDSDIDGLLPGIRFPAPVTNTENKITEPEVVVMGLDTRLLQGFEDDVVSPDGLPVDIGALKPNEVVANQSAQKSLSLRTGDLIEVLVKGVPRTLKVAAFVRDKYLTGWTQAQPNGIVLDLTSAQILYQGKSATNIANNPGFVAVSNKGSVRDSLGPEYTIGKAAIRSLQSSRYEVNHIKHDRIERAKELGSNMTAIFVVLGLFSIAAGLLLVFLILVMLAAERRPELGMSRAIGMKRAQLIEAYMSEGMAYSVTSAAAGAALGVAISVGMTRAMQYIFNRFDVTIAFHVTLQSIVVSYCLGVVLTFVTVTLSSWRVSRLSIVAAIRETNEPPARSTGLVSGIVAAVTVLAGAGVLTWGLREDHAYAFGVGLSLMFMGGALVARAFGGPERPVFTVASLAVLVLWVLVAGGNLERITGNLNAGLETFFVGGVLMVAAATFLVIYNAEVLLGSIRGVGFVFARALPAVRTSIAYPLANKFRTGMTIAMLSLVVFALVMISTMNLNFRKLFLNPDARGGWDIQVAALPINSFPVADTGNRLGPLGEALRRGFYPTEKIDSIAQVAVSNPRTMQLSQVETGGAPTEPKPFKVLSADNTFLEQNAIALQARADGYATDRAVWDAVRDDPNNAVIDGSVVPGINYANVTESRFTLDGYESGTKSFPVFPMIITDTAENKRKPVRIIGIMSRGPSETYAGMWINKEAGSNTFPELFSRYYIRLKPGNDAQAEAKAIESTLAKNGVSARSIQHEVEKSQALSSAFFYLVQGFMGLGLAVGLAALGVIAFRTVVERRQQIGLMRAIGFSKLNVALTFLLESAFISILGIANGIVLALLLANRLLASDAFSTAGFTTFYVPWLQIGLMAVLVFVASVLTTLVPSRQASSLPIAEALRYE